MNSPKSEFVATSSLSENVRCPVCASAVDFDAVVCPRCSTPHHRECWQYIGGCAIFGCDDLRWRPMAIPASEEETHAICVRTEDWLTLFRYHWTTFVIMGVGIVASITAYSSIDLFFALFPPTTASLKALASIATTGELLCYCTAFVGMSTYLALAVPAYLRQRSLEKLIGSALPQPNRSPDAVAERLELPAFGQNVLYMYRVFAAILTGLCGITAALVVFSALRGQMYGIWSLLLLIFLRIVLIPWFHLATRSRVEMLVSAQNRMLASFKDGKASK